MAHIVGIQELRDSEPYEVRILPTLARPLGWKLALYLEIEGNVLVPCICIDKPSHPHIVVS